MRFKLFFFLLALPFFGIAQNIQKSDSGVKIYSYKNRAIFGTELYKNKIWWIFYKFDYGEKTIQYVSFEFEKDDKTPDLTNVNNLFKDEDTQKFIVLKPNKIKVKRTPSAKRAWNDFATPRKNDATPAETFIFKNGTFTGKNKGVIFVLDKELTLQYQQEKQKSGN